MIRQIFRQADQPQPFEKVESTGRVKWGKDNLYGQFLVGLAYDNPIHGGILNQKVTFITSGGVNATNTNALSNGLGAYDYEELVDPVVRDFEIFNGFAVKYVRELSTGFWHAEPIDFELLRPTENGLYIEYSDDWSKSTQNEKTGYKMYKSIFFVDENIDTECIFYNIERPKQRKLLKDKNLTANYFPVPNYSGAITSIMAGIEMDFFTFSEVVNGYKGGTVISLLNGVPDSIQEENKVIDRIKGEATDRDTQGGLTVLFADGKDRAPEINQMNGNDLDKRYIESDKNILRKIMIAHSVVNPTLFGVLSETLFGSKEEMEIAYILYQENYIKKRQRFIEKGLNWAYKRLNKEELGIEFIPYKPSLFDEPVTEVVEENPVVPVQLSEDTTLTMIDLFSKSGIERSNAVIIDSRPYTTFEDNEGEYKQSFLSNRFEMTITDDDRNILQMIKNGESYDSISKAIGKGGVYLSKRLLLLAENGYLNKWEVTDKGQRASATLADIEVMYSYELKPNAPALVPGGSSRPFCERLIQLDRLYTRQEIDAIGSAVDRDVWTYRGGWYHNPDTDKNTPSCRHIWKQNIIAS